MGWHGTVRLGKAGFGMDKNHKEKDGFMPKKTYEEIWKEFSGKHGDNSYNRQIHLKWKKIAAEVKNP